MLLQDPHSFVPVCHFTMLLLLHGRITAIQSGSAIRFGWDPLYPGATCHVVNIYILYRKSSIYKAGTGHSRARFCLFVVRYSFCQTFPGVVCTHSLQRVVRSDHDIRDVLVVEPVL